MTKWAIRIVESAVDDAVAVEDAALDYVEQHLGPNYFIQNWQRLVSAGTAEQSIAAWLRATDHQVTAAAVLQKLTQLYDTGTSWLTPFNSGLPAEK